MSADRRGFGMAGRIVAGLLLAAAVGGCGVDRANRQAARAVALPYEWGGEIDPAQLNEPSGIVYHAQRGSLFLVGDEGDVMETTLEGELIRQAHLGDRDFEGITFDPASGLIYVAEEGAELIHELGPDDLAIRRTFTIQREFRGRVLFPAGGDGIESLTFRPDPTHPEGGTFFTANQTFLLTEEAEPSVLVELVAPLRTGEAGKDGEARVVRYSELPLIDIAGLQYDPATDHLLAVSDATNTFLELTCRGKIVRIRALTGANQEGITLDGEGNMYLAQDSGGLMKIRWRGVGEKASVR